MIYKLGMLSKGNFVNGTFGGGKDSSGGGMLPDGSIHLFAGTDNTNVFNDHHKSTNGGVTFAELANAAWAATNEQGYASLNSKIYVWGGNLAGNVHSEESWYYDNTGWHQIAATMTNFGSRFAFAYTYHNGYFYTFGGNVAGDVIRSTDLVTWETVLATVPTGFPLSHASATSFKGKLWIAGGYNGATKVSSIWSSDDDGFTWTKVLDSSIFDTVWCSLEATEDVLFFMRGTNGTTNQKGCYISEDGITWNQLLYEHYSTHAATSFRSLDRKKVYVINGNDFTGSVWELRRVDQPVDTTVSDAETLASLWADNGGQSTTVKNAAIAFLKSLDRVGDDPNGRTVLDKMVSIHTGVGSFNGAKLNMLDPYDLDSAFRLVSTGTTNISSKGFVFGNSNYLDSKIYTHLISGWDEICYGHYTQDFLVGGFYESFGSHEATWPYDTDTNTYITINGNANVAISNGGVNKKGDWGFQRNGNQTERWQSGVKTGTVTAASDSTGYVSSQSLKFGRNYTDAPYANPATVSLFYVSEKLSPAEHLIRFNAIEQFMTALNMNITP